MNAIIGVQCNNCNYNSNLYSRIKMMMMMMMTMMMMDSAFAIFKNTTHKRSHIKTIIYIIKNSIQYISYSDSLSCHTFKGHVSCVCSRDVVIIDL